MHNPIAHIAQIPTYINNGIITPKINHIQITPTPYIQTMPILQYPIPTTPSHIDFPPNLTSIHIE